MMPSDKVKIRESKIYNPNVKDVLKIASIGDLHLSKLVGIKDVDNILKSLDKERPNYICMLGDIIDSPKELFDLKKVKEFNTLVKKSASIAPTFIILGNHDFINESTKGSKDVYDKFIFWKYIDTFNNVYLLNDKSYEDENIFVGGYKQKIDVYYNLLNQGIEDSKKYYGDLKEKLTLYKNLPKDKLKIFLTHSPEPIQDSINQELLKDYDLILTGHYHNGCVPSFLDDICLPENRGIITPRKKLLPKEARGIILLDTGTYLVYNGGWTKISACGPKFLWPFDKICNRQMDVITVSPDVSLKNQKNSLIIKNKTLVLKRK